MVHEIRSTTASSENPTVSRVRSRRLRLGRRLPVLALAALTYLVVQYNAVNLVAAIYGYFEPRPLGWQDHLVALGWLLGPVLVLPLGSSPASAATWIYYCFVYLSSAVVGVGHFETLSNYSGFMALLAGGGLIFHLAARTRVPALAAMVRVRNLDLLLIGMAAVLVLYIWQRTGFAVRFDLVNVYDRRLEVRGAGGIVGYLAAPLRLLLPIIAVYAWQARGNLLWPALVSLGCIAVFAFDGTKTVLLTPFVFWGLLAGLEWRRLPALLLSAAIAANVLAWAEHEVRGSTHLAEFGIRRAFVVPGTLASIYYEYGPRAASLRNITYEVGDIYFGSAEANANTNFLMWGWAWAGWWGVAAIASVAGLIVALLRPFPGPRFPLLGALMAGGCMLFWAEQFLHTSMLSSGLALLIAVAVALRVLPQGFPGLAPVRQ